MSSWLRINGDWFCLASESKAFKFEVQRRSYIDQFGGRHITGYDVNLVFINDHYVTVQQVTSNEAAQEFIKGFIKHYFGDYKVYDCEFPLGKWDYDDA